MKRTANKTVSLILATVLGIMCCFMLGGCSLIGSLFDFGKVEFTRRTLSLEVGDSYDLARIIESDGDYTLSSSNRNVASVNGTTLTANGAGKCTVTAKSGAASSMLSVTVTQSVPVTIAINSDGALIQTVGSTEPITFTAEVTGVPDDTTIRWSVSGATDNVGMNIEELDSVLEPFTFIPTQAGEFEVCAEIVDTDVAETVTVRAYYPIEAAGHVSGSLTQTAPAGIIELVAEFSSDPLNPRDLIRWIVDGKPVYEGHDKSVAYIPELGSHILTLEINGVRRDIDGSPSVELYIEGSQIPTVSAIEFDNLYPHAYLVFDAVGDACVEITSPDGIQTEYSQTDAEYAELFGDGTFDIGGLVDICASSSTRRAYKFRVRSLGDGGAFKPSAYSAQFSFTQLPSAASKYISSIYCDKDMYITSDVEFVNLLEYEIIARPKKASSTVAFDCYIAYELAGTADDLWNNAFEIAATSGRYTNISVNLKNNVFSISFRVNTVNTPSKQTYTGTNSSAYSTQLHAIMPHINYDREKYRDDDYTFAIDERARTQSVTYTDELYFAAENNARPVPASGSVAETVYELARNVLRQIVTDDMTDVEKAHAIYDWIMWQVTYDTPATTVEPGEAYSAYYLEGVFGDGQTPIGGVRYYPYAVCDGLSKAYSLMCNIEGIPCVRVSGIAGSDLADARGYGHAWNKVFVNGAWYVVDCTWGDVQSRIRIDGIEREYELALHDHLFLTDEQADLTHFEAYESGDSDIIYAPAAVGRKLDVYSNMSFGDKQINCVVGINENGVLRSAEIAREFAETYTPIRTVYIPGGPNKGIYSVDYQAFEIIFEGGVPANDSTIRTQIQNSIRSVIPDASVVVRSFDELIIVLVK